MINSNETPVCARCKHLVLEDDYHHTKWDYLCGTITHEPGIHPITGEGVWFDSKGERRYNKHPYCNDFNKRGQCKRYEPKGSAAEEARQNNQMMPEEH